MQIDWFVFYSMSPQDKLTCAIVPGRGRKGSGSYNNNNYNTIIIIKDSQQRTIYNIGMCGNSKVGSVTDFRNPNRTMAKKSNPKFGFPRCFWKPKTGSMKTYIKIKATTFSQYISLCLFNNWVILIMLLMKLQYHQVLQYRRLCLRPSYKCWPVCTIW